MKKLFIIIALIAFVANVNAQRVNTTLKTDASVISGTVYSTPSVKIEKYSGLVGFFIKKTDVKDSLTVLRMEGSMDATNYIALTGAAALTTTTTDGTVFLYETSPKYLYYRLNATAATGDTVTLNTVRFIYKEQ